MGVSLSNFLILNNISSIFDIIKPFDISEIYGFIIIILLLIFSFQGWDFFGFAWLSNVFESKV